MKAQMKTNTWVNSQVNRHHVACKPQKDSLQRWMDSPELFTTNRVSTWISYMKAKHNLVIQVDSGESLKVITIRHLLDFSNLTRPLTLFLSTLKQEEVAKEFTLKGVYLSTRESTLQVRTGGINQESHQRKWPTLTTERTHTMGILKTKNQDK